MCKHDTLLQPPPPPRLHLSTLARFPLSLAHEEDGKLCKYVYTLISNLVRLKTTTVPFVLNDVWSVGQMQPRGHIPGRTVRGLMRTSAQMAYLSRFYAQLDQSNLYEQIFALLLVIQLSIRFQ